MIVLLIPFLLLLNTSLLFASSSEYDIVATYDEKEHRIYGSEKITFVNDGTEPLPELYLFLYPNLYLEKDPDINESLYKGAYPSEFNPGELQITSVQDLEGNILPYFPDFFKKRILMKIRLPAPIPPDGTFEFLVHFMTLIPEKYGVFGYYQDLVTLQGGWHPYLPRFVDGKWHFHLSPPKSQFRIHFTVNKHLQLLTTAPLQAVNNHGTEQTFLFKADNIPFFSFSIGQGLIRKEKKVDQIDLIYHALKKDKVYAKQVMKSAKEATSFFLERSGPVPPATLQMAESYLYQDLTTAGSNMLYLNTRLFKVFPALKRFHVASIARGIFLLLWHEKLPWEEAWVIEGLAYLETEAFVQRKYGEKSNLEQWLTPVAFIPLIDQILYSRDLPLRQVYFKESVAPIINEDIQLFNHPRPEGTTIFSKLTNLLGELTVDKAVAAYRKEIESGGKPSFRKILHEVSGKDLHWFFNQWLTANPALDFGIDQIERKKIDEGYMTSITLRKNGEGIEPLEILVHEKNGSQVPLVWEGDEESHEEVLITPSPVTVVELDPQKQSSDPNLFNNRQPHAWKVLLNRYPQPRYDFNTRVLSYQVELLFQPVYDYKNRIVTNFSHSDEGNVGRIEYSHIFKNNHTMTGGLTYQGPQTPEDKPPEEPAGTMHLGYSLNYPDIPLFAGFIQQLTGRYPKLNVTFGYDQRFTGGEYERLFKAQINLRRVFSFSNYHEIGSRLFIGQSYGTLFENSRFFLGGGGGMRGYTPLRFEGNNMSLFSVEYRFPIFYETDLNLAGLALTHTLQGALFADAGDVTDSRNVFRFADYKSDVGAGIRWFADSLGFYPIIFRFDVAYPIRSPIESEKKPHFYITAGQPF